MSRRGEPAEVARSLGRPRSAAADRSIIDAALACFAESGLEGLTMDAVAARAGVSKATIYRRYPGKVELVMAAAEELSREQVPIPDTGSLSGDLRATLANLTRLLTATVSGRAVGMLAAEIQRNPELAAAHRAFIVQRRRSTAGVVQRAVERGELPPGVDAELLADLAIAPVFHRALITGDPLDDAFLDAVVGLVIRAFR